MDIRLEKVTEATLHDWQYVHNTVIPPEQHSIQAVRDRSHRNYLVNAYKEQTLIGNATLRPPVEGVATLIVRVLPEFRRQGFGEQIFQSLLRKARELKCSALETVVLGNSEAGLAFARSHGFKECERYRYPDHDHGAEYVTLRLAGFMSVQDH